MSVSQRPIVTASAFVYRPGKGGPFFTWVEKDPEIGAQPYIYVWAEGADVAVDEPIDKMDVSTWNHQEGAPTVLAGRDAFVRRCDAWLSEKEADAVALNRDDAALAHGLAKAAAATRWRATMRQIGRA